MKRKKKALYGEITIFNNVESDSDLHVIHEVLEK